MPTLYITEFSTEGVDSLGQIMPVAKQLPLAQQALAFTATSAQSATLNASTTLVRLQPDATCSVLFGANPTALTTSMRMASNQTEYFAVQPNSGLRVAAISNS